MPAVRHLDFKDKDLLLMIGTVKGSFLARRRGASWDLGGPHFAGQSVYAMAFDARAGRRRLWAGTESAHWGAVLRASDDFGRRWTEPKAAHLGFPKDTGLTLERIFKEMSDVPFRDHVWPKFLRENALRLFGMQSA